MQINYMVQRYWLNFKRHRLTLYITFPVFTLFMILIASLYSPDFIAILSKVPIYQTLMNQSSIPNTGRIVWFLIFTNIFVLIFPVIGILLGIRMLPFNERDGKELLFSTKMGPVKYFFENVILVAMLILLTALPVFLVSVVWLGISKDSVVIMAIATILPSFFVMVIAMVTVWGASIKSSTGYGYAFGGIVYIVCFALNILASELGKSPLSFLNNISPFFQMKIFQSAYNQDWNVNFLLACTTVIIVLFILSVIFLYRSDYIESRHSYVKASNIENGTKRKLKSLFGFVRAPTDSILARFGWNYPAFRDQLQASSTVFILYTIITTLLVMVVVLAYPGDSNMQAFFNDPSTVGLLNNPFIAGFMFGHQSELSPNLVGFLLIKLLTFNWLYYGPFLFIGTYYVVMRDKTAKYDEITWSLPRTRASILVSRTGAMIFYFWITMAINWIGLWIGDAILSTYMTFQAPDISTTIITFFFLALGYSLFLIFFIAIAITVNQKWIWMTLVGVFALSLFIPMVSFTTSNNWLDYLSPFRYFDVVGLLINKVNIITTEIPTIVVGGIITMLVYVIGIKYYTPRKDLA